MTIRNSDLALMIVGSSEVERLDQDLYEKSLNTPNIIYVGRVQNTAPYFATFDFLILPSYREGFGMTVLEAAAMGVPSIISNIKGPTDLIRDGYNGIVCEVKSVEGLRNAIITGCKMNSLEYKIMCDHAYQEVVDKFDAVKFKKAFLENRNYLLDNAE